MELLGLLFLVALWDVTRHAVSNMGSEYKRSRGKAVKAGRKAAGGELPSSGERKIKRHHARGWWAGEISKGFPALRTGWHTGWLAHRTATEQRRAAREEARTTHLETKASVLGGLREHRQRQADAQKEIDEHIASWNDLVPSVPVRGREAVREAGDELARKRSERESEATAPPMPSGEVKDTPEAGPYAPPGVVHHDHTFVMSGQCPECGGPGPGIPLVPGDRIGEVREEDGTLVARDATVLSNDGERILLQTPDGRRIDAPSALPLPPTRRPDGKPETEADKVDTGNRPDMNDPEQARNAGTLQHMRDKAENEPGPDAASWSPEDWPTSIPHRRNGDAPSPAPKEGNAMSTGTQSEVTHSAVVASAQQYAGAAEQDAATAESRRKELETMADQMQALDVDSASLSEVMELADLHRQQEATAKQIQEHAAALPRNLQQRHGQLDEAHREAPVRAAERGYYGEG